MPEQERMFLPETEATTARKRLEELVGQKTRVVGYRTVSSGVEYGELRDFRFFPDGVEAVIPSGFGGDVGVLYLEERKIEVRYSLRNS